MPTKGPSSLLLLSMIPTGPHGDPQRVSDDRMRCDNDDHGGDHGDVDETPRVIETLLISIYPRSPLPPWRQGRGAGETESGFAS